MTAARESRALAPAPRVLSECWESERWSLPLQPCAAALRCCAMDPHEPDSQLPLCQTWPYRNSRVFLLCACVGAGTTRHRVEHSEKNLKTENKINVRSSTACLCQADEKRSSISLLSSLFFVKGIHKVVLGKLLGDSFGPRVMGLMSFPRSSVAEAGTAATWPLAAVTCAPHDLNGALFPKLLSFLINCVTKGISERLLFKQTWGLLFFILLATVENFWT